ncbi:MAG: xanthine dehydrogenase family protein molybdopterin-binding subunit [Candidatus Rokubacteria bacterium]|nr:xanthine dehydrogenase family protein molybdopterin-binding subunit [Candidatus Rokubacteria bacterium]
MIGTSIPQLDALPKLTGQVPYTINLQLPQMLHAKILRSKVPHARVLHVKTTRAAKEPGVKAVLTREEVLCLLRSAYFGPVFKDQPVVAIARVLHVGDPIAAVAAVDEETAEGALGLIDLELEELPAVFSPEAALAAGAPILHARHDGPRFQYSDLKELIEASAPETNICTVYRLENGNLDRAFREAPYVFEHTFTCPTTQHCPMEPHAALAQIEVDGKITVWSSTQSPFILRAQLAELFDFPLSRVRVIVPPLGGAYGAKIFAKVEPIVICLSMLAGRPVKAVLTREEEFLTVTKHAAKATFRTAVGRDGRFIARHARILWDTGAYAEIGPRVIKNGGGYASLGPYRIPHLKVESYCVYTNKPPAGAFRGFGVSQVAWAGESQIDMIARELGRDPLEFRQQNLFQEGDRFHTGDVLHSIGLRECLDRCAVAIGWGRNELPQSPSLARGKGLAVIIKHTSTPSVSTATLKLNEDGSVNLLTSTVDIGQGARTILPQIVAEELGIPIEHISLGWPDTDVTPYDTMTASSRSTFHMGTAVRRAVEGLRQQLRALSADLLEAAPDDVEIRDGRAVVRGTDRGFSFGEVVRKHFGVGAGTLVAHGSFKTHGLRSRSGDREGPLTSAYWSVAAGAAEVEVDRQTGHVRVLRYVTAVDVGKALNPLLCEGQIRGSVVLGVGQTFHEELAFEEGQPVNPNLLDYRLPCMMDIPEATEVILVETPHQNGPFGAKGAGEPAVPPVAPAIGNAIADAIGVRLFDLPLTPERVLRAVRRADTTTSEAGSRIG